MSKISYNNLAERFVTDLRIDEDVFIEITHTDNHPVFDFNVIAGEGVHQDILT